MQIGPGDFGENVLGYFLSPTQFSAGGLFMHAKRFSRLGCIGFQTRNLLV